MHSRRKFLFHAAAASTAGLALHAAANIPRAAADPNFSIPSGKVRQSIGEKGNVPYGGPSRASPLANI